jgi:hypothetical protein
VGVGEGSGHHGRPHERLDGYRARAAQKQLPIGLQFWALEGSARVHVQFSSQRPSLFGVDHPPAAWFPGDDGEDPDGIRVLG